MTVRDLLRDWLAPTLAGLLAVALNLAWLAEAPEYVPVGDDGGHLGWTWAMLRSGWDVPWPWWPAQAYFFTGSTPYPPLVYWVAAVATGLTPASSRMMPELVGIQVFLPLLALGSYWLGTQVAGRAGGWLALALSLASPHTMQPSRNYFLDLPLAALIAGALAALVASDGFRGRRASLAFGLLAGLALLTKWSGLFFLVPPVLAALLLRSARPGRLGLVLALAGLAAWQVRSPLLRWLHDLPSLWGILCALAMIVLLGAAVAWLRRREPVLANLAAAALVATLVAGLWYGAFVREVVEMMMVRQITASARDARVPGLFPMLLEERAGGAAVVDGLREVVFPLPAGPLVLVGLLGVRRSRPVAELAACLVGAAVFLAVAPNFYERYLQPLIPVGAALAAAGAARLGPLARPVAVAAGAWAVLTSGWLPASLAPARGWPVPGPARVGPDARVLRRLRETAAARAGAGPILVEWQPHGRHVRVGYMNMRAAQEDLPVLFDHQRLLAPAQPHALRVASAPPGLEFRVDPAISLYLSDTGETGSVRMDLWELRRLQVQEDAARAPLTGPAPPGVLRAPGRWLPFPQGSDWPAHAYWLPHWGSPPAPAPREGTD